MFHAFHCYTPFQFSIFHFHCAFWIVGFEFSPVSISLSPPFLILILSLFLSFFFLPPFEDGALVLLFSKCRTEMREMLDEKLKGYASFSLSMCFFSIFFTACSLFLLKLPFLSQKASIFISKLHECASFSLSMCFFFIFSLHVRCFF
ncbi:hypothetical protein AAZX31_10G095800 [Glycine max]